MAKLKTKNKQNVSQTKMLMSSKRQNYTFKTILLCTKLNGGLIIFTSCYEK